MVIRPIKSVAVFCGSNFGFSNVYMDAAIKLGATLANEKITLIYGGSTKGLMGVLADTVLNGGGIVHGVVTQHLHHMGQSHKNLTYHEITDNLALRKARMIELADAFIVLPGGIGTTEELMEVWSMNQLIEIDKPVGLLNVDGFFSSFLSFIDHMIATGFLPSAHKEALSVSSECSDLLAKLSAHQAPNVPKWLAATE